MIHGMIARAVTGRERRKTSYVGLVVSLLLISPSILWVTLDRQAFGGDQSEYGTTSIALYRTLTQHPAQWPHAMLNSVSARGPGVAWLGQFFVPLGDVIGSFDIALILS